MEEEEEEEEETLAALTLHHCQLIRGVRLRHKPEVSENVGMEGEEGEEVKEEAPR